MNLHAIAGPIVAAVNPTIAGTILISNGEYATAPNGTRTPGYDAQTAVPMQVQALTWKETQRVDGLNIQGTVRAVYLYGDIEAVNRPRQTGGDVLLFDNREWLVLMIFETWPGWCKVAVVEQVSQLTPEQIAAIEAGQ